MWPRSRADESDLSDHGFSVCLDWESAGLQIGSTLRYHKEVQALMLSWHWQWLMHMTAELAARDCVQVAGPVAALAAESMAGNCIHDVTVGLEVAMP